MGFNYFVAKAVVRDAKTSKGIRASLYRFAQDGFGRYAPGGKESSIYFQGTDLHICILFESMERAQGFLVMLTNRGILHSHFGSKLEINKTVESIHLLTRQPYIFLDEYVSADNNESPDASINHLLSESVTSSVLTLTEDNRKFLLQSVEAENFLASFGSKFYRCHLIPKEEKNRDYKLFKTNHDNFIYESWMFHEAFGASITDLPGVTIRYESFLGQESVEVKLGLFEDRDKVSIIIEFREAYLKQVFGSVLKDGTESISDTQFRSFIHV